MANANLIKKMRSLHRCLGYFVAGLMLIYAITGVLMVYRDTDVLKHEVTVEKQIKPGLSGDEVGGALKQKNFKIVSENANVVTFENGTYEKATGKAVYSDKVYYAPLNKMAQYHKIVSTKGVHWVGVVAGVGLLLLVVTSFFMFSPSSKQFKNGMIYAIVGLLVAVLAVFLS